MNSKNQTTDIDVAFIRALETHNLEKIMSIPKSDLHNHAPRGGNLKTIESHYGVTISPSINKFKNLDDMQLWYEKNVKIHCIGVKGYLKRIEAAFLQAKQDGVSVLSMSFGMGEESLFDHDIFKFISAIKDLHLSMAPDVKFIPEVCFSRSNEIISVQRYLDQILSYNFFKSIDLVGDDRMPVDAFKPVYRTAKAQGLLLKAHVGEFGDAESVRRAVDALELDHVQHGIAAATSKDVMTWLSRHQIVLNICPTSNVMLSRVDRLEEHPIKTLYHQGVPVTLNSDDMLIFNSSVSEEFLKLYQVGVFSASELNEIRRCGLNAIEDYRG